jgi:hypothetical protein
LPGSLQAKQRQACVLQQLLPEAQARQTIWQTILNLYYLKMKARLQALLNLVLKVFGFYIRR